MQPQNIEDIMALISLYRPGPMGSGMDKLYIDRKHGRSKITYDHEKMEKVLGPSLGIMLYQEDVLGVSRELAGFSSAEADDLRKAIGKKQMDKISLFREKFVTGCMKHSGLTQERSNKIYSDIEYFGGYGFNRAHAASYAMISYITAYLKTNFTVEYMAALMSSVVGNKDKQSLYLADCRKRGIKVVPPSINWSQEDFGVVDEKTIIFGLAAVNGIGYAVSDAIISSRTEGLPYTSMHDFFRRTSPAVLKKGTLEHLIKAGAFDELIDNTLDKDFGRRTELRILEQEKEELGLYVSKNPVDGIWDLLSEHISHEIIEISEMPASSRVSVAGIVSNAKKIITKKGAKMFKFNIQDISSDIEVLVFPREAKNYSDDFFNDGEVIKIIGSISKDGDDDNAVSKIVINSCEKLDLSAFSGGKPIYLKCKKQITEDDLNKINDIIKSTKGGSYVFIEINEGLKKLKFKFNNTTSISTKEKLEEVIKEMQ
jgi:DNA polymerase-3 subunit alpha